MYRRKGTYDLNAQIGPSGQSFAVMNTTVLVIVYNSSGLAYEKTIMGESTNFNATGTTSGYGYVNFQSTGSVSIYATDAGKYSGCFAFDLWNYFISNFSASLIALPPHF